MSITFVKTLISNYGFVITPSVADINNDGLVEPLGFINHPLSGLVTDSTYYNLLVKYPSRIDRDNRLGDINGDGYLDVFANVYDDFNNQASYSIVFWGDGNGGFKEGYKLNGGSGETVAFGDVNNDGYFDIFNPIYTHSYNAEHNYLYINDKDSNLIDMSAQYGVEMRAQPVNLRVEGAQFVDIDFDGWLDLYVGSHLFINDKNGAFIVKDFQQIFDEGAKVCDIDNDGDFDVVLQHPNEGVYIFYSDGKNFTEVHKLKDQLGDLWQRNYGMNMYDVDGNGYEDIVTPTLDGIGVFKNINGQDFSYEVIENNHAYADLFAFGDFNGDLKIDLVARENGGLSIYQNNLEFEGTAFRINLLDELGNKNQFGHVVKLNPLGTDQFFTRAVDGGSGYLSQNQYEILVNSPFTSNHEIQAFFEDGTWNFEASGNSIIDIYSTGKVKITGDDSQNNYVGNLGNDEFISNGGDDTVKGNGGDDTIDGGLGFDESIYIGLYSDYTITYTDLGYSIKDNVGGEGTDTLLNIEQLVFADQVVALPLVLSANLMSADYLDSSANDWFDSITGSISAIDPDGNILSYSINGGFFSNDNLAYNVAKIGSYGTLLINNSTGAYNFVPNDTAIEGLKTNASENFDFVVSNGRVSASVVFAVDVAGVDDLTSFGGDFSGVVRKRGNAVTEGKLSIFDRDVGDTAFIPQSNFAVQYGLFTIDTEGDWSYTLNKADANVQALKKGYAITETIAVNTMGGVTQDITVIVSGGSSDSGRTNITAGEGDNSINISAGKYHIASGSGNDTITSGSFNDHITAGDGNNIINSDGGNDRVTSGDGDDTIMSAAGHDIVDAGAGNNIIHSGVGSDRVTSGDGDDTITAEAGHDTIHAGNGNNNVDAGKGNDKIITGNGGDIINGGKGADTLTGGLGSDVFIFDHLAKDAVDKITDFDSVHDLLRFDVQIFTSLVDGVGADNLVIDAKPEAHDSNDYFLFDTGNSRLYYDSDGDGSAKAVALVTLTGVQTPEADDFSIF